MQENISKDTISQAGENKNRSKRSSEKKQSNGKYLIGFLIKMLFIAIAVFIVFTRVFGFYYVQGEDMFPSIKDGDLVLYYRLNDDKHIGDVLIIEKEGKEYAGRIVAQAGDEVDMDEDGQLYLNGALQSEEIFFATLKAEGNLKYPFTVSDGCYFLLCDYRTGGTDSRTYGEVSAEDIKGKAMTILRRRGI